MSDAAFECRIILNKKKAEARKIFFKLLHAFLFTFALFKCFKPIVFEKIKVVSSEENQINCWLSLLLFFSLSYLYFIVSKTRTDNCNLCVPSIELEIKRPIILSLSIVISWEFQRQS